MAIISSQTRQFLCSTSVLGIGSGSHNDHLLPQLYHSVSPVMMWLGNSSHLAPTGSPLGNLATTIAQPTASSKALLIAIQCQPRMLHPGWNSAVRPSQIDPNRGCSCYFHLFPTFCHEKNGTPSMINRHQQTSTASRGTKSGFLPVSAAARPSPAPVLGVLGGLWEVALREVHLQQLL